MTTYTSIPDTSIDPESPVTTSLLTRLRDNPLAIAEGAAGAPRIQAAAIAGLPANSVGQSEVKESLGTVSVSSSTFAAAVRTLPGGLYGFYPQFDVFSSGGDEFGAALCGIGDPVIPNNSDPVEVRPRGSNLNFTSTVLLYTSGQAGVVGETQARQRYITASPPYDLGNGEIPLFVFAHMRPGGAIGGLYVAEDPPWAYNGPTDIRPHKIAKDGRKYRLVRRCALSADDVITGRCDMDDLRAARKEAKKELVEIDHAMKNADMHLHPHSWVDPVEGRIVLLDPLDPIMETLREINAEGGDVTTLVNKALAIGEDTDANSPPGVTTVSIKRRRRRG